MRRHESLIGRDDAYSLSACYQSDFLVAYVPWSGRLGKEFYIRNIIDRIDYPFKRYMYRFLFLFFLDLKILDESILFEKFQNLHLEIGKRDGFY